MKCTLILFMCYLTGRAHGWRYYHSRETKNWTKAREWCQEKYTDMVAIQSQEENDYLVSLLPNQTGSPYYWIGITKSKKSDPWTWVGNNSTWIGNQSWATNEPNNNHSTEFCVEIYVNKNNKANRGKWNDEKCSNLKYPVCYQAQCNQTSCSRGRCRETINDTTCLCEPGFRGDRCQTAVPCDALSGPQHGRLQCYGSYGPSCFNSSCQFHCDLGYRLEGPERLQCQASGRWDHPAPRCQVERCTALNPTSDRLLMTCSHPIANSSFNSTCAFSCEEGFELSGQSLTKCDHEGKWTADVPTCSAQCNQTSCSRGRCRETINGTICLCEPGFRGDRCQTVVGCPPLSGSLYGHLDCSDQSHALNSTCRVGCPSGSLLLRSAQVTCSSDGTWHGPRPICTNYKHALMALAGCGALGIMSCICFWAMKRRKRKNLTQLREPEEDLGSGNEADS